MLWQDNLTRDPEKRYNSTRRQKSLMNVLHPPVEIATQSGHSPCKENLARDGVGYWRSTELLGGIRAADYSQIADHLNRVFYTTIVTNYAADFSVA